MPRKSHFAAISPASNRKVTTIIGSSVQNHYKHAFFGTMNAERPLTGHDLFMTAIEGGRSIDTSMP